MHPFSVMQSFPTGRFITLCFYCFFWLKSFFPGIKKTALRLFLGARYWIRTSWAVSLSYWPSCTPAPNSTIKYNFLSNRDSIADQTRIP